METIVYTRNLGADDDRRAMRGRQGPVQEMLATNVQDVLAWYQQRNNADRDTALDWFRTGMARHWAWNVSSAWGIDADGPFSAVTFR